MAKKISFIIPLLNEKKSLEPLASQIHKSLSGPGLKIFQSELILIDDGSTDNSFEAIKRLGRLYDSKVLNVRGIQLTRNSGKTKALNAGISRATGDYVVMMDADLQDDPKYLPDFIKKLESGKADLVVGNRTDRYRVNPAKLLSSKLINAIVRRSTGYVIHDINCGFKAMKISVAQSLNLRSDYHRFIPLLAAIKGYRIAETPIKQRDRKFGNSKYGRTGLFRLTKSLLDITSILFVHKFQENPFSLFGRSGFALLAVGFIVLVYLTVEWFLGVPIGARPLFFLGILLVIGGINIISLGLLGELMVPAASPIPPIKETIKLNGNK